VTGAAAAMFEGATNRTVVNCNLDADTLVGQCWGTFKTTLATQGKFEGTWSGPFALTNFVAFYSGLSHGIGDKLRGSHMSCYGAYPGDTWYATFMAHIEDDR
jgi:hypothetical protein